MLNTLMARISLTTIALALSISANAIANPPANIDIPAGVLIEALRSLSTQSDIELVYQPEQVREFRTTGVKGTYTLHQAIDILLKGTPLKVFATPSGAMIIAPPTPPVNQSGEALHDPTPTAPAGSRTRIRFAQANQGSAANQAGGQSSDASARLGSGTSSDDSSARTALEEIIVTAQKREERLQDVPVPVTALSADALLGRNQTQLQDYLQGVPSVTVNNSGDGQNRVVIRGLVTGGSVSNPTTAVTIDDIPFGTSQASGLGGRLTPDLDPASLARVEVLRGPQGTLYGASGLGGLLKFVTADPSLTRWTGYAQLDANSVDHGESGYGLRGTVSIPLITDTLAVSVGGFKRHDPGFIDNPVLGTTDINSRDVNGGRLSLLWKPSEGVSLKIGVLTQDTISDGANSVDVNAQLEPTLGDLQQNFAPGTASYETKVRLYSAVLEADIGRYHLTSLTGYGVNDFETPRPFTSAFWSGLAQEFFGVSGNKLLNKFRTEKFSQELRLSSPLGERIEWVVGAFYTDEKSPTSQNLIASDPATGAVAGTIVTLSAANTYEEYALFGNLTVHFTDQFDMQFGARESQNRQTYNASNFGVAAEQLFGGNPTVFPEQSAKADAFTFLMTPRFKVSPDLMVYARFASGYRAGGNNGQASAFNLPMTYEPDTALNYELGVKGALWGRALTYDVSIYHIDWKDVQLFQQDALTGFGYLANGGKARSRGVELALQANPIEGLTASLTAAYTDAVLGQDLPLAAGVGYKGERLPYSNRFSASAVLDSEFPLSGRLTGFVGATVTYTGDRLGSFVNPASREPLVPGVRNKFSAYTSGDVRAGVLYDTWRAALYVTNVTDERGVMDAISRISGSSLPSNPFGMTVTQPRTYGLTLSKSF